MNFFLPFFGIAALGSALLVIRSRNPIYSVLSLILCFCSGAALLLLIHLDFFAMVFLVVYVGAIGVLFLFVVMMINIKQEQVYKGPTEGKALAISYIPLASLIGLIFVLEVSLILNSNLIPIEASHFSYLGMSLESLSSGAKKTFPNTLTFPTIFHKLPYVEWATLTPSNFKDGFGADYYNGLTFESSTISSIGALLYTYFVSQLIIASLILLLAMIGAIVLNLRTTIITRRQEVFTQNLRLKKKFPTIPSIRASL
jgi:NADH-quinone oxidoreductase subunit J